MIDVLLFVSLFVIVYIVIYQINISIESNNYKKRNNIKVQTKENSLKNFFSKINFINSKENYLSKQGYPLKLNAISYYSLKIFLVGLFLIAGTINYGSVMASILLSLLGYFCVDVYIFLHKKNRNNEICVDLLKVVDSIILQMSAEISLKDSIKYQYRNCKNEDFRKAMLEFSTQYAFSELNIEKSIEKLKDKFDILELNMFCNSLKEYNKVENIVDILENLSEMLKTKYIEKVKEDTRAKVLYITLGVIIALGNIILITFYPLFISIGQGFNNIFS